jgi:hypothetical protein
MGSSTWSGNPQQNNRWGSAPAKSAAHKMLERQLSDRKSLISKALRLDQEEELDHFHNVKVRRGIENARRNQRNLPVQHWKTPYEVDAPRAIMLPREHPHQESSSSGTISSTSGTISVEQQIWQGIEQLMADAFSSDEDCSSVSILPEALVKAMSARSLFSHDSGLASSSTRRRKSDSTASEDEIEMAQVALHSFMDLLMPNDEGKHDDDCSLPTLASWHASIDGSSHEVTTTMADKMALAEAALNNFMNILMDDVEKTHKPATLALLDLFSWTLRVNVDAQEKLRFLETEETANERKQGLLEEEIKRHEERRKEQIEEDLKRHEKLLRQKEAEEAELMRLEEEGNRLEEMLRQKVEEAARLREDAIMREQAAQLREEVEMREYIKPLNDALPPTSKPSTPAGRRRAEAERRQKNLSAKYKPDADNSVIDTKALAAEIGVPLRSPNPRTEQLTAATLGGLPSHSRDSSPMLHQQRQGPTKPDVEEQDVHLSIEGTPRSFNSRTFLPRQMSGVSMPTLSSLGGDTHDEESSVEHDTVVPLKSAASHNAVWATIGGVPIVVSSDDDRSIDPMQLANPRAQRAPNTSLTTPSRLNFSSTEFQNRRTIEDKSSGTISTLSTKSVPVLMPSESKRTLKAASMYEESDFSIDPSTLPNLADFRQKRHESEANQQQQEIARLQAGTGPQWAAIGGRQIMMPTSENGLSSNITNISPETAESGVLPSSFHSKQKLSSSGSVSTPSTRTLHNIPSKRNLMYHVESASVHTCDDMPDLRSLSETSYDTASAESEMKEKARRSPIPKLFASKYSPRGSAMMRGNVDDTLEEEAVIFEDSFVKKGQTIFSESFVDRMESAGLPRKDRKFPDLPSSFIQSAGLPRKHELPSSFFESATVQPKQELPSSFIHQSVTNSQEAAESGVGSSTLQPEICADLDGNEKLGGTKKKKDKKKKDKKKKDKTKNKKQKDFYRPPSQKNLVVSAMGDVFLDDVQAQSLHNIPEGHFDSQISTPDNSSPNASFLGTEVRSVGSAGDIHLGSGVFHISDDDDSVASDMSIDPILQLDELLMDGGRQRVPATKDAWKRQARRRQSIGTNIFQSIKKCWWLPMRRKGEKQKLKKDPELSNSNGNLCLLHEEDTTYDRTPVLRQSLSLQRIDEHGFAPM